MSETIKNIELSTDLNNKIIQTEVSNVKNKMTEIKNSETMDFNEDNSDDTLNNIISDIGEEGAGAILDITNRTTVAWSSRLFLSKNINISYHAALSVGRIAARTLPVVSTVAPLVYETVKYGVIEGEGIDGLINHKYEISGAVVGGAISGLVMAAVFASNPAGWVVAGALGACALGSIAIENIGAYYDNYEGIPIDYMSNVYFY